MFVGPLIKFLLWDAFKVIHLKSLLLLPSATYQIQLLIMILRLILLQADQLPDFLVHCSDWLSYLLLLKNQGPFKLQFLSLFLRVVQLKDGLRLLFLYRNGFTELLFHLRVNVGRTAAHLINLTPCSRKVKVGNVDVLKDFLLEIE